jgi:hypothetical protein
MPKCECCESRKKFRDDIWLKNLSIITMAVHAGKTRIE